MTAALIVVIGLLAALLLLPHLGRYVHRIFIVIGAVIVEILSTAATALKTVATKSRQHLTTQVSNFGGEGVSVVRVAGTLLAGFLAGVVAVAEYAVGSLALRIQLHPGKFDPVTNTTGPLGHLTFEEAAIPLGLVGVGILVGAFLLERLGVTERHFPFKELPTADAEGAHQRWSHRIHSWALGFVLIVVSLVLLGFAVRVNYGFGKIRSDAANSLATQQQTPITTPTTINFFAPSTTAPPETPATTPTTTASANSAAQKSAFDDVYILGPILFTLTGILLGWSLLYVLAALWLLLVAVAAFTTGLASGVLQTTKRVAELVFFDLIPTTLDLGSAPGRGAWNRRLDDNRTPIGRTPDLRTLDPPLVRSATDALRRPAPGNSTRMDGSGGDGTGLAQALGPPGPPGPKGNGDGPQGFRSAGRSRRRAAGESGVASDGPIAVVDDQQSATPVTPETEKFLAADEARVAAEADNVTQDNGQWIMDSRYRCDAPNFAGNHYTPVYTAVDLLNPTGPPLVLKVARQVPRYRTRHGGTDSKTGERMLQREARALYATDSPHVIRPVGFQTANLSHPAYLVLPFFKNGDLGEYVDSVESYNFGWAMNIIEDIITGLEALLKARFHHLDVKPGNVLLDEQLRGVLSDLGLARDIEQSGGVTGMPGGTLGYRSPEQARRESRWDQVWTDIYATGAVGYKLFSGKPPYERELGTEATEVLRLNYIARGAKPAPLSEVDQRLPSDLSDLILRLLAVRPQDRVPGASERDALRVLSEEWREMRQRHADLKGLVLAPDRTPGPGTYDPPPTVPGRYDLPPTAPEE